MNSHPLERGRLREDVLTSTGKNLYLQQVTLVVEFSALPAMSIDPHDLWSDREFEQRSALNPWVNPAAFRCVCRCPALGYLCSRDFPLLSDPRPNSGQLLHSRCKMMGL